MGQKVHPIGFTVGYFRDWKSRWACDKANFSKMIHEDYNIRKIIKKEAKGAGVSSVEVERRGEEITVFVSAARQGILIGKKGQDIDRIRGMVQQVTSGPVKIIIKEVSSPDVVAQIVSESIAEQLEKRMAFRRVLRKSIDTTLTAGAKGVKIQVSGRLNGAEMARREKVCVGRMPLSTMRSDIDYGFAEAHTTYGLIGIKVWIYQGQRQSSSLHANSSTEEME
ncbi:MAG: 30S ribosomal protein S3 [Planctomycetes bacterium]|nr:30S ribosomal protein S3 [Planctomycetota bacterium]